MYASSVWSSNLSKTNLLKLEQIQSKTLRNIFDLPWFVNNLAIRKEANIKSISELIIQCSDKLIQNIISSQFPHIHNISKRSAIKFKPKNN